MLFMAIPLVAIVRVLLWLLPSPVIIGALRRVQSVATSESSTNRVTPTDIVRVITAVASRIPRATCLTQALSAWLLLRWFGCSAQVCLGVGHNADGTLRAHAWLERDGRAVIGGDGARGLMRLPRLSDDVRIPTAAPLTR